MKRTTWLGWSKTTVIKENILNSIKTFLNPVKNAVINPIVFPEPAHSELKTDAKDSTDTDTTEETKEIIENKSDNDDLDFLNNPDLYNEANQNIFETNNDDDSDIEECLQPERASNESMQPKS